MTSNQAHLPMKIKRFNQLLLLTALCVASWSMQSCNGEDSGEPTISYLTLSLQMPTPAATRDPLAPVLENAIADLDVLVFRVDAMDGTEKFLYRVAAEDIVNATTIGNLKNYTVKLNLSVGAEQHRIVLLANLRTQVDAITDARVGATKETLLQTLTFDTPNEWNVGNDAANTGYQPIPMWGEVQATHIITPTTNAQSIGVIGMVRALARVDVGVKYNASYQPQGLPNFVLTDVYVHNANTSAAAIPLLSNGAKNSTTGFFEASQPTIITGTTARTTPLYYPVAAGTQEVVRQIYVAETKAKNYASPTATQLKEQFCIVVGGYFSTPAEVAGTPNTTVKSYYRIDIFDRTAASPNNNLLDILRNRVYKLNITAVFAEGLTDPTEALDTKPINNLTTIVTSWVAGGTPGVVTID